MKITQQHGDKVALAINTYGQISTLEPAKERFAMKTQRKMNAPHLYEIRVAGHLSKDWAERFEGLSMRHEPEGETVMSGMLDQAALHGVFMKIRDLGLNLISVSRVQAAGSN